MMSPLAGYMTGPCITLDGGEVLKSGQEFSRMTDYPRDQLKQVMAMMWSAKK